MKTKKSKKEVITLDGQFININDITYALVKCDGISPKTQSILKLDISFSVVNKLKNK